MVSQRTEMIAVPPILPPPEGGKLPLKLFSALYIETDPFGIFEETIPIVEPEELEEDGVLIIWGGIDISPYIYKQKAIKKTQVGDKLTKRDREEMKLAYRAMEMGIPIIGICRGAQLMCALSGGSLFQDVTGHHGHHEVVTEDGEILTVNSAHHQMMNPFNVEHRIIAHSLSNISEHYLTDKGQQSPPVVEPEVVYFPQTRAFCIQGHPEWLSPENPFVQYCSKKMKEILF